MSSPDPYTSPGRIVRLAFAGATIAFGALGVVLGEARLLVAAGAFGVMWTLWDILWDRLFAPLGDWTSRAFTEGGVGMSRSSGMLRPTLDDTIRLLESHLAGRASRGVEIQSALRLEEIYRTVRKNPEKADRVARLILDRYPEARELERLRAGRQSGSQVEGE